MITRDIFILFQNQAKARQPRDPEFQGEEPYPPRSAGAITATSGAYSSDFESPPEDDAVAFAGHVGQYTENEIAGRMSTQQMTQRLIDQNARVAYLPITFLIRFSFFLVTFLLFDPIHVIISL